MAQFTTFPMGDRLVTWRHGVATIWNASSGRALLWLETSPRWIVGVAVSLGGDVVATCDNDQALASLSVCFPLSLCSCLRV